MHLYQDMRPLKIPPYTFGQEDAPKRGRIITLHYMHVVILATLCAVPHLMDAVQAKRFWLIESCNGVN